MNYIKDGVIHKNEFLIMLVIIERFDLLTEQPTMDLTHSEHSYWFLFTYLIL